MALRENELNVSPVIFFVKCIRRDGKQLWILISIR